tara:strand:- start:56 stop:322 length:267 start_codon:yes stop_codon:yes gene_type:complete
MKLELKTEQDYSTRSLLSVIILVSVISFVAVICSISLKLGNISKYYELNYLCKLLTVEKSNTSFKKLSNLSKLTSKQKIWEFCRNMIN